MEKRIHESDWISARKYHIENEEEIYSFDFEGTSNICPISNISSFVSHPLDSSKENVELSLEVEIADSLKHLIVSPDRYDSALVDVTIVRPTDLDCVPGLENSNTLAFKGTEVRNLIASMERQKQHKKKLIEECKRKVATSRMNPIKEAHAVKSHASYTQTLANRDEHITSSPKRRLKRSENARNPRYDIAVSSAPPKTTMRADCKLDNFRNIRNSKAAPIAILKPLVGEIKESLKSLEATIGKVGDQSIDKKEKEKRKQEKKFISTSDSNLSSDLIQGSPHLVEAHKGDHTQQIYATPKTYDKLRTLLTCQNPDRDNEDNDKPCLCQHCGMVGLLVESQKRPIVPVTTGPPKKGDGIWPKSDNKGEKDRPKSRNILDKTRNADDAKCKSNEETNCIIRDLSIRLEALEVRLAAQEQHAVPRDYFKRIISKLWHKNNLEESQFIMRANNTERNVLLKDHSTQYSIESFESILKPKKDKLVKHRNVQIQQNTRKSCCVNPVFIVQDNPIQNKEIEDEFSRNKITEIENVVNEDEFNRNKGTKAINAISDFFVRKSDSYKKSEDRTAPKGRPSPMDTFWKWGEEIIKPGFDLKTKIITLLDEQFRTAKPASQTEQKSNVIVRKSHGKAAPAENTTKPKSSNTKSPASKSVVEKPQSPPNKEQNKNEEKVDVKKSSSKTLKKMLDMMSEKIYNEHVKPTVEAMKEEQKCFNCQNSKQIDHIKAAMDAALNKITTKEVSNEVSLLHCDKKGWQKDFLEPLEIPAEIKRRSHDTKLSKLRKKSGIPVRVSTMTPTDSILSDPFKFKESPKSLIPRLKSPSKDYPEYMNLKKNKSSEDDFEPVKDNQDRIIFKRERRDRLQKQSPKKQGIHYISPRSKPKKNSKPVQIKYLNPKAEYWNEESGSVQAETSEDNNQALTDIYSTTSRENKEEIRRISEKYSVTDKLAFLINVTKEEMGKAHVWNNILKEAKNHCKSKQDTVIIQIPTKYYQPHRQYCSGMTEVEFTIDDIQKLVDGAKLKSSSDISSKESVGTCNMDSFLLIHSKKILQEVHKRLGQQMVKN